jgi:ankyrin repeat protein
MSENRTLADEILAALHRACREGDMEAAEHLLRALETIASRDDAEVKVQRVYAELARSLGIKPRL